MELSPGFCAPSKCLPAALQAVVPVFLIVMLTLWMRPATIDVGTDCETKAASLAAWACVPQANNSHSAKVRNMLLNEKFIEGLSGRMRARNRRDRAAMGRMISSLPRL